MANAQTAPMAMPSATEATAMHVDDEAEPAACHVHDSVTMETEDEKKGGMGDCPKKAGEVPVAEVRPMAMCADHADTQQDGPKAKGNSDNLENTTSSVSSDSGVDRLTLAGSDQSGNAASGSSQPKTNNIAFTMVNSPRSDKILRKLLRSGIIRQVGNHEAPHEHDEDVLISAATSRSTGGCVLLTEKSIFPCGAASDTESTGTDSLDGNGAQEIINVEDCSGSGSDDTEDADEDIAYTPAVATATGRRMMRVDHPLTPDSPASLSPRNALQQLRIFQCNLVPLLEDAYRMLYVLDRVGDWSKKVSFDSEKGQFNPAMRCAPLIYLWVVRIFLPAMDENVTYQRELCGLGKMYPLSVARFFVALSIRASLEEGDMEKDFDDSMLEIFPMDTVNFDTFFYSCCLTSPDSDGDAADSRGEGQLSLATGADATVEGAEATPTQSDFAVLGTSMPLSGTEDSNPPTGSNNNPEGLPASVSAFKYPSLDTPLNNMLTSLIAQLQAGTLPKVLLKYLQPSAESPRADSQDASTESDTAESRLRPLEDFKLPTRLLLRFCDAAADVLLELLEAEETRLLESVEVTVGNSSLFGAMSDLSGGGAVTDMTDSLDGVHISSSSEKSPAGEELHQSTADDGSSKDASSTDAQNSDAEEGSRGKDKGRQESDGGARGCLWEKVEQTLLEEFIRLVFFQL